LYLKNNNEWVEQQYVDAQGDTVEGKPVVELRLFFAEGLVDGQL
jgi:hypothetical protein